MSGGLVEAASDANVASKLRTVNVAKTKDGLGLSIKVVGGARRWFTARVSSLGWQRRQMRDSSCNLKNFAQFSRFTKRPAVRRRYDRRDSSEQLSLLLARLCAQLVAFRA